MKVIFKSMASNKNQSLVCLALKRQSKAIVWHRLNSSLYPKRAKHFSSLIDTRSQQELLSLFYEREIQNGCTVIEAAPGAKLPKFKDEDPKRTVYTNGKLVSDIIHFQKMQPMLCWRHKEGERTLVVDFDFYKIENLEEQQKVKTKLLKLSREKGWTAIGTPRGGLHLYFSVLESNFHFSTIIASGVTQSLIPHVDWLGGAQKTMGPNGNDRPILNLCEGKKNPPLPWYFHAIGKDNKTNTDFIKKLKGRSPLEFWVVGNRATGMLKLMTAIPKITDSQLDEYNQLFPDTPKPPEEMQITVFNRRPQTGRDILEFQDPFEVGVCYDVDSGKYFTYSEEDFYWKESNVHSAGKKLILAGIPIEGMRLDNFINRTLSIENISEIRKKAECALPEGYYPLYYKNKPLFLIRQPEGTFGFSPIPLDFLKNNFITTYLEQVEYNLEAAEEASLLELLASAHVQNATLYSTLQMGCPAIFDFIQEKTTYESEALRNEVTQVMINLIALVFFKSVKNYNEELFTKKIVVITGTGDSGKSAFVKLLAAFTGKTLNAISDLHRLSNGKFETSRFHRTVLNLFPDQDETYGGRVKSLLGKLFSGVMKALSGGDQIATERKFKDLSETCNRGICVVTTNARVNLSTATANAYGAMKTRLVTLRLDKQRQKSEVIENYEQTLLRKESAQMAAILASFETKRFLIFKEFSNFDFEALIYREAESRLYTNQTCSYFGFISQCLSPQESNRKVVVDIGMSELFAYFVQYCDLRKRSCGRRLYHEYAREMNQCFETLGPPTPRLQRIWDKEFQVHEDINAAAAQQETVFIEKLHSRGSWVAGFTNLEWVTETRNFQTRNHHTGQFEEAFPGVELIAKDVSLDLDFLESLPNFHFAPGLKRKVSTIKIKPVEENMPEVVEIQKQKNILERMIGPSRTQNLNDEAFLIQTKAELVEVQEEIARKIVLPQEPPKPKGLKRPIARKIRKAVTFTLEEEKDFEEMNAFLLEEQKKPLEEEASTRIFTRQKKQFPLPLSVLKEQERKEPRADLVEWLHDYRDGLRKN